MDGDSLNGVEHNPLFDICPSDGDVTIEGKPYKIKGLPFRLIIAIAKDAPDVLAFFFGGKIIISSLMETSPGAVERIIAGGFGFRGDPKEDESTKRAMAFAGDLPLDLQLDLMAAILTKSTGGGAGPFVARLRAMQIALGGQAAEEKADATVTTPIRRGIKIREPTQPPNDAPPLPQQSNTSSPEAA
jgi:hypothetical protein